MAGHLPFEVFGGIDAAELQLLDEGILDEADGLERAVGMLGKDPNEALQLSPFVSQRGVAEVRKNAVSAEGDAAGEQNSAQQQEPDGAQAPRPLLAGRHGRDVCGMSGRAFTPGRSIIAVAFEPAPTHCATMPVCALNRGKWAAFAHVGFFLSADIVNEFL